MLDRISVLVVAKGFPPDVGGIETYSEQLSLAYSRRGMTVTVITAHLGARGEERRAGIRVLNVGTGPQGMVFARMLCAFHRLSRETKFDLIHATSWRVAVPALILRIPVPIVVSVHGREVFIVPHMLTPVMRLVFRSANAVVAVSRPIMMALESRLPFSLKRAGVSWNGISFGAQARQHIPAPDFKRIFCLCRLIDRKNVASAVRAVAMLRREGFDITFEIAGSGPEGPAIDQVIEEEGVGSHVRRLGRISDAEALVKYRNCGIFLHPQIATNRGDELEGFGISIADAMSFGAVAIAGASGGPLDFIDDDRTGVLVDGHDVDAIANAVRCLLTDVRRSERIAEAGRAFALEELTWDRHVEKVLELVAVRT